MTRVLLAAAVTVVLVLVVLTALRNQLAPKGGLLRYVEGDARCSDRLVGNDFGCAHGT